MAGFGGIVNLAAKAESPGGKSDDGIEPHSPGSGAGAMAATAFAKPTPANPAPGNPLAAFSKASSPSAGGGGKLSGLARFKAVLQCLQEILVFLLSCLIGWQQSEDDVRHCVDN